MSARVRHAPSAVRLTASWPLATMAVAMTLLASACGPTRESLPPMERRYYDAMDSQAQRDALLSNRKASQREAYLKASGLTDRWAALPVDQREGALSNHVEVGYYDFALFMAWGQPATRDVVENGARRVEFLTYVRCTSGPHAGEHVMNARTCDGTSTETKVAVETGLVTEIRYLN